MRLSSRRRALLAATSVVCALAVLPVAPAVAGPAASPQSRAAAQASSLAPAGHIVPQAGDPNVDPSAPYWVWLDVIPVSTQRGVTRWSPRIATTQSTYNGPPLRLTVQTSVARTVGVSFGMSAGVVSAQLGLSRTTSVSVAITCSAKPTAYRRTLNAYAIGDLYKYRIRKREWAYGRLTSDTTSAILTTFNPTQNAYQCVLE